MKFRIIAEDVVTMKEKSDEGILRIRRWAKINVKELENTLALNAWTEVNPREQNLKSKPAKAMRNTLNADSRDIFHFLNRGVSISALNCSVKNIKDKKELTIELTNTNEHGIFDGGHTFKVLTQSIERAEILGAKHVMLEIFTGVDDILFDLARSRNTSTQVKEKSLANLEGKFDFIKSALKNECFFKNIAWVENDIGDISINFIIQILTTFNNSLDHKSMPRTYSGAGSCETSYIKEFDKNIKDQTNNIYYKLTPLYPDIFKLVDHINKRLPNIYNSNGYESERGIFGRLKGITYKPDYFPLLFSPNNQKTSYKIPNAMIFPILASMRQLYKEDDNGMFEWIINPITTFDELSTKLVTKIMGYYFDKQSFVNEMGKSLNLWIDTYEIVRSYLSEHLKDQKLESKDQQLESKDQEILELKRRLGIIK